MSKIDFGVDTCEKKLEGLSELYDYYLQDTSDPNRASIIANQAWHMTDWVFKKFPDVHNFSNPNPKIALGNFRDSLYSSCESLKIMHDVGNTNKHVELDLRRGKVEAQDDGSRKGDFSASDFCAKDFYICRLEITLKNGTKLYFDEEIKAVIDFWKSYFANNLNYTL